MWRALYRTALNPEAFFDVDYLRALMQAVGNPATNATTPPV
ncbi:MAG: hypothetical protein QOE53_1682, partial [Pseudonocardiales bacterium]|nr:hypothetical protein [Pseudonocardiales bacterium]